MVVRTGNMAVIVEDVAVAVDRISKLADTYKGFVVSSRVWKENERTRGAISIRVEASSYEAAMNAIAALAMQVNTRTTTAKDVTEEYTDLKSRLGNLEAAERQLLQIMEKATKVEDVLAVQKELTRVRGDIEQTRGRMQYLERTTSTSIIDVTLEQSKLDAKFTADRSQVTAGESIRFTAQIAGGFSPYGYQWDFGDGSKSTLAGPSHVYAGSGTFTVSLKVTDDRGNAVEYSRKDYVTVLPGWAANEVASSAWNGLVAFGRFLASVFIWVGVFSPLWIIIGVVVWYALRRRRKSGGGGRGPSAGPPTPPAPAGGGGTAATGPSGTAASPGASAGGGAAMATAAGGSLSPGAQALVVPSGRDAGASSKSRLVAVLLVSFLGPFGAHRFYIGRMVTAGVMLAVGLVGFGMVGYGWGIALAVAGSIWAVVDFALLLAGKLRDGRGRVVRNWAA